MRTPPGSAWGEIGRGKLFYRLVQQGVLVDPVPYKSMVKCAAG